MPREHDGARDQLRAVEPRDVAAAEEHPLADPQAQHGRHVQGRDQGEAAIARDVAAGVEHQPAGQHPERGQHQPECHQMRGHRRIGRRLLPDHPGAGLAQPEVERDRQHQGGRHDVAVEAELADAQAAGEQEEHGEVRRPHHQPGEQHPQGVDAASRQCMAPTPPRWSGLEPDPGIGLGQQPVGAGAIERLGIAAGRRVGHAP